MKPMVIYDPIYLEHDTGKHPESPDRLRATIPVLQQSAVARVTEWVSPRAATEEDVAMVHDPRYIRAIREVCRAGGGYLDMDTVTSPRSYDAALMAAGGAIRGVDAVLSGEADNALALVRPPGHHSMTARAMGFCIFNNVAIAAKHAVQHRGLSRVLIVDWDVHHGNGTHDTFYEDDRVLYFSTHQYPHYPGTGAVDEVGRGPGRGYTVNVPLPAGTGDVGYLRTFREILRPVAERYRPELVLVSAGYDPHWADPLAGMEMSVTGFADLAREVAGLANELCDGHLVAVLEGGYNLQAQAYSILGTLSVFGGSREVVDPLGRSNSSEPSLDSLIASVRQRHGLVP